MLRAILSTTQIERAMQINLPPELEPFVEQEFATGRYAKREEILVQALRWMSEERKATVVGIKKGLEFPSR